MKSAPLPDNEALRLSALERTHLLDSLPERSYDDITYLASHICETPIALVSLIDADRQWFKSRVGLEAQETSRDVAFCSHAILQPEVFVVSDTLEDDRFHDNPLVTADPGIRFYAGAPLVTSEGFALGTLCAIDRKPRRLQQAQIDALKALSRQVIAQIELSMSLDMITDLKNSLEESNLKLEKSNEELQHFAHLAAHDLKSPLRTVGNLLEVIKRKHIQALDDEAQEYFGRAIKASHRMSDFLDELLEFSNPKADKVALTSAADSLADAVSNLDSVISESGASIQYDDMPRVKISAMQLTRVFQNLISNAIKYSKKGEQAVVQISVEQREGMVEFKIVDNGIGMHSDQASQLFKLHKRLDNAGSFDTKGSGIGLFACRKIIEAQGGQIWIDSEPGKGSAVHFTLPLADSPD